jgi:membrane-associated phospholipid phosphatase
MFTTYSYTVLWLIGRFKPWRSGFAPILILINVLCSVAMFVLATRITDNKHHSWDVAGGAAFGIIFGASSYFIYFENPLGPKAGAPKKYAPLLRPASNRR